MLDQPCAEIDRFLQLVLRRRWEAGSRVAQEERHLARHQVERHVMQL